MTVRLRRSDHVEQLSDGESWVAVAAQPSGLDEARRLDSADALERRFDANGQVWLDLGRALAADAGANLAHTPACVANASDLGLMMAWTDLVRDWAAEQRPVLVVCDDPWIFRHLAGLPGVTAGQPPRLWLAEARLALRGMAARLRHALAMARRAAGLARPRVVPGQPWLLAYAHPRSTRDGEDGYFGDLMRRLPRLHRVLHVDGEPVRAATLLDPGRCESLHAWGSALAALRHLPLARWRPHDRHRKGPQGWLVRRAAALEGATAQAAAIRWQQLCQRAFLAAARPSVLCWPWENHAWERDLVRAARAAGVPSVGYQHSVIGRQMLNYAAGSLPDPEMALPDRILCTGPATLAQLTEWKVPAARLGVGGGLRFAALGDVAFDADGVVFMALPFDLITAAEMVVAARRAAEKGWRFLVKDHPMTPFAFAEDAQVRRATVPLSAHKAVRAVVYAATTVGLEALLMGLPTLRFRPSGRIALDILPTGVAAPVTSGATLAEDLTAVGPPPPLGRDGIFAPVDQGLWTAILMESAT